jgi:hypothetical protein
MTTAIKLDTHIGGGDQSITPSRATSPPYDPEWDGFTGNYSIPNEGAEMYPRRFQVTTPEIEAAVRDPMEAGTGAQYNIAIPDDLLETEV